MSENRFPELQHLLELPFTKATRLGQVQFFHFGQAHVTNASGLILDVGAWTLEVACHWQLEAHGKIQIRFQDVEIPRDSQALADPTFDPLVPGSNLRDRKLQELVHEPEEARRIWQITASPEGELTIGLTGKQLLRVQPSRGVLENIAYFWRLFHNTGDREELAFGPKGITRA